MASKKRSKRADGRAVDGKFAPGSVGNPDGRRGKRRDAWSSTSSGLNSAGRDRVLEHSFCTDPVGDQEALDIWRGSDVGGKVVEDPPSEMFREGFELKTNKVETTAAIVKRLKALQFGYQYKLAKEYERALGGAALMPIAENAGADLSRPIDLAKTRIVNLSHFLLLEPRELTPWTWYRDISAPKFGKPETYRLVATAPGAVSSSAVVHESRLIVFPGRQITRRIHTGVFPGWGDSIFTRIKGALRGLGVSWDAVPNLIVRFSQSVLKVKNLADLVAEEGWQKLSNRIAGIELTQSILRMMLIDHDEEFSVTQTPVTGLEGLLDRVAQRFCASAGVPMSRLIGETRGGLTNTGDADIRWYYDRIAGDQDDTTPNVERGLEWVCADGDGPTGGKQPEDVSVEWRPLWQPTDKEIAETHATQATADEKYIVTGTVSPETVARSRFGGQKYSLETVLSETELAEDEAGDANDPTLRTPGAMPGDNAVDVQRTVLAGPQVGAMLEVATASRSGRVTPEQAIAILSAGFMLDPEVAKKIAGTPMESAAEVKGSLVPASELGTEAALPGSGSAIPAPGTATKPPAPTGSEPKPTFKGK